MNVLCPTGIGDVCWALHKIQSVAQRIGDGRIDVWLSCVDPQSKIESRALDFVRRFPFVDSVSLKPYKILKPNPVVTPEGYWNYIEDGHYEFDGQSCVALMPNAALERGTRLENWLPNYDIDWDIFKDFRTSWLERRKGKWLRQEVGPYAVFYLGPLAGNTTGGHNRNALWKPDDWVELGRRVHRELGLQIVVVGAEYDTTYSNLLVYPLLNGDASYWHNFVGQTNIGELFSVTQRAKFVVSYQAGVGIVSTYLGVPTAIFWRPKGDSIAPDGYLSFEEAMSHCWTPPGALESGRYKPLIYGKHSVNDIMEWAKCLR